MPSTALGGLLGGMDQGRYRNVERRRADHRMNLELAQEARLLQAQNLALGLSVLDIANASAEILLTLIDEILDFSRLEAGKLRIETLDFELRRAVESWHKALVQRRAVLLQRLRGETPVQRPPTIQPSTAGTAACASTGTRD